MIALIVSKDRAFTPEAAARTGKVVIFIQSGIHAGEIEGKDTVLMLVRDMTVSEEVRGVAGQGDLRDHPGVQRGRPRVRQPLPSAQPERSEVHRPARQRATPESESRLRQGRHAGDARLAAPVPCLEPGLSYRQPRHRRRRFSVRRHLGHGAQSGPGRTRRRLGARYVSFRNWTPHGGRRPHGGALRRTAQRRRHVANSSWKCFRRATRTSTAPC